MVKALDAHPTIRGNVAQIYAHAPVTDEPLVKKRISSKMTLIVVSSALVTFLLGMTLIIVFK